MHREDDSRFLLYIEPKASDKLDEPSDNKYLPVLEKAMIKAKRGTSNYSLTGVKEKFSEGNAFRGSHTTDCGEFGTNVDYLLDNGMITNYLAPFYLKWYYDSIPETELKKLEELYKFYNA